MTSFLDEFLVCDEEFYGLMGVSNTPVFIEKMKQDINLVEGVCKYYNKNLIGIDVTMENSTLDNRVEEPLYFFSDNCGGYTKKGLENNMIAYFE